MVIIFGYVSLLVFILGIAYRVWKWARLPIGFNWGLYPKPTKWTVINIIWRALAWPTLFQSNKLLWICSVLFHIGILLLFIGHLGLFFDLASFLEKLIGISPQITLAIGVCAGVVSGIMLIFYIGRRFFTPAREISSFSDHFWLWFLLAIIGTGIYSRVWIGVEAAEVREFAISIITLKPILPPQAFWFLIHALLAELFIIYSVTGKFIHFIGQFFTQYILISERE